MSESRTTKAMRNIRFGMGLMLVTTLLSFAVRTVLIRAVGIELVGLNGLFTEVIGALSLAELGVGSSIAYSLYAPLAEGNEERVSQLMQIYRRAYTAIAGVTLILGLAITPFVHLMVRKVDIPVSYIRIVYVLFVVQLSSSYLFSYKTALLNVDQKNYIFSFVQGCVKIAGTILQLVLVALTKNYLFYVAGLIFISLATNVICARIADRQYPCLAMKTDPLPPEERKHVFANMRDIFIKSVSGKITGSTDNILISTLIFTALVGYYTNYNLVFNVVRTFAALIYGGVVNSVGNMMATESDERSEEVFRKLSWFFYAAAAVCSACIFTCMEPFVRLWLGEDFLLPTGVLFVTSLVIFLEVATKPLWLIMEVSGLFSRDKYASIIGSAVNLVTSIVLGLRIGMAGIFIGTCLTYAIQFAMKAYFLYRLKWNRSPMRYCLTFAGRTALLVALMLAARAVTDRLPVTGDLPAFLINGCLTAGAAAAVLIGTSAGTPEFAYAKELIIKRLRG